MTHTTHFTAVIFIIDSRITFRTTYTGDNSKRGTALVYSLLLCDTEMIAPTNAEKQ